MTCKDCIHYDVCDEYGMKWVGETLCHNYKDKPKFIELPCKVGDTVWKIIDNEITSHKIYCIEIYSGGDFCLIDLDDYYAKDTDEIIGKDVFLSYEEAEKALSVAI